ncbi:MAG: response regulator [Christensenellales bacterium]|jgi:two-component system response regulator YesN
MYRVLIVDDDSSIRKGLMTCVDWSALGCEVCGTASNGEEALRMVEKEKPDILLSDIKMPKMTGLELAEAINNKYPSVKCILLTGIYEFDSAYNAIKFGVIEFILKPTSSTKVADAVRKAVALIKKEQEEKELRENAQLQKKLNLELKRSYLLAGFIDGVQTMDAEKALDSVGLTLDQYSVVTILLCGMDDVLPEMQRFADVEESLRNYIDVIFAEIPYYCVFRNGRSIHVIANLEREEYEQELRALCIELSRIVDNLADYNIAIGISRIHHDPHSLAVAGEESKNAASFAQYGDDKNPVVCYSDIPRLSNDTISAIMRHIGALAGAIERLNTTEALKILDELLHYCRERKIPISEYKDIGIITANLCLKQQWHYNYMSGNIPSSKKTYYSNIYNCTQPDEVGAYLRQLIESTISELLNQNTGFRDLVKNVENYILNNYRSDLSLEMLAKMFHISSGHLSRLFKARKNTNITSYIHTVRIERAKELIRTTDLHTYEIAEAVGIQDPVYFSKLFKKYCGMRVRDYRQDVKHGHAQAEHLEQY